MRFKKHSSVLDKKIKYLKFVLVVRDANHVICNIGRQVILIFVFMEKTIGIVAVKEDFLQ